MRNLLAPERAQLQKIFYNMIGGSTKNIVGNHSFKKT